MAVFFNPKAARLFVAISHHGHHIHTYIHQLQALPWCIHDNSYHYFVLVTNSVICRHGNNIPEKCGCTSMTSLLTWYCCLLAVTMETVVYHRDDVVDLRMRTNRSKPCIINIALYLSMYYNCWMPIMMYDCILGFNKQSDLNPPISYYITLLFCPGLLRVKCLIIYFCAL